MDINAKFHDEIRKLDVNSHKVSCNYKSWNKEFKEDGKTLARIAEIEKALREKFGRAELVEFYKSNADTTTKFLSAMIWGYEAPAESRKDNRGPSRAKKMLESISASTLLNSVKVDNERRIMAAYKEMDKEIKMCGPSFITKHLYFLGKSSGTATYPLIFDNRVSVGLVKMSLTDSACLDFVSIQADKMAYLAYLKYAGRQASLINCDLDKVEYFLFLKGG